MVGWAGTGGGVAIWVSTPGQAQDEPLGEDGV